MRMDRSKRSILIGCFLAVHQRSRSAMPKLTKQFIESEIKAPVTGQRFYCGEDLPGFAVRVTRKCKHNFAADIEMINIQQINEAYDRILKQDVKYRFVINMASLKK